MKSRYKAGLIRVITLPDAEAAGIHGRLIMEMFPNMTVETKCIPDQPDGLHSVESKNTAIPKIIEVAQSFKDIDVLIVSCADDPAVPELKNIVNVPVIGAGSSVAAIARRFGTKVGILGITDYCLLYTSGKLSDERFIKMSHDYELEQSNLKSMADVLRKDLKPVSYTHLDVYKRQQYIPTTEEGSRKKMYRSMGEPSAQVHLSSVHL